MKKKLGLLAGLALCVTVGGVYATWTYAEGGATNSELKTVDISITAATNTNSKGTIDIVSSNLTLVIENDGNYNAVLKPQGEIEVKFTPAVGASVTDINVTYALAITSNWFYDLDQDGVKDDDETLVFTLPTAAAPTQTISSTVTWKIEAADLGISLAEAGKNISLPTYADYMYFKNTTLSQGTINIVFREAV